MIAQRISMISGVAQVNVFGAQKYAVRVQLDPNLLAARGIGIDEVANAHPAAQRQPARPARCGARARPITVQATGQLISAAAVPAP